MRKCGMQGFSLVELSIVLVILGLLTGGILSGQSLIHAAELRAVSTEHKQWMTAMHTFRDKYLFYPGDMPNATKFWGALGDAGVGSCPFTPGTGTETCDGDGDGFIEATYTTEPIWMWKHLTNAGLIEGSYSGTLSISATAPVVGVDLPATRYGNQGVWLVRSHIMTLSAIPARVGSGPAAWPSRRAIFPAEDAWNIDSKMDDGLPLSGGVQGLYKDPNDTTVDDPAASEACSSVDASGQTVYALVNTGNNCYLVFPRI